MLYLCLCLASGLWFIYIDQKNNFDFLSAFTWHLSSLLIIFVLPGIIENSYGQCLYGLNNKCSEETVVFSSKLLLLQTLSFGASYFIFRKFKKKLNFNFAKLNIQNEKIVYMLSSLYFFAFIDLFFVWSKNPSLGGLYENMKGHGWANHLTFPLGTILGTLLFSAPRYRKLGSTILVLQLIFTIVFLDRKTQTIQMIFCILFVLFFYYRDKKVYKTLSKFLVYGLWLISLSATLILFLENDSWTKLHELLHSLRVYISYNLGHFYVLSLSYQNMPENFSLSPMIFSRSIPYYAYFPSLNEWSTVNNSIVEQWIYGTKVSPAGGFPFLSILKIYLSLGYSGVFIFSIFWGFVFSQISNQAFDFKSQENSNFIYSGITALLWAYFLNLGIPSLQFPMQLFIITALICTPFSKIKMKLQKLS